MMVRILIFFLDASEENPKAISQDYLPEEDILISRKDLDRYKEYLEKLIKERKYESKILKETAKLILRDVYIEPTNRKNLVILCDKINQIIDYGIIEPKVLENLLIMKKI